MKYTGPFGLICWHINQPTSKRDVALRGVDVQVRVVDLCAVVQLSQRYQNDCPTAVQAEYVFPIDSNAAVSGFESETDGVVTKGVVKEKRQAKQEFHNAVAHGQTAQLFEQERADVFQMSVGNLQPYSTTTIRISYVVSLKVEGDGVKFFLPSFVAPRYQPATETNPLPPTATHNHTNHTSRRRPVAEGLRVEMVAAMASDIIAITSETPGIGIIVANPPNPIQPRIQTVSLAQGVMSLDKDLVLKIRTTKPHEPRVIVERSLDGTYAAVVSIVPNIEVDDCPREIVFVVDRSGSMRGEKMGQTRKAMQLFVRSLPEDCFFQIVGFGSSHQSLFSERGGSAKYSAKTLAQASTHINQMSADLGGTEILRPLREVLSKPARSGYARQVFVLTDGQVSNTDAVVALVRQHVKTTPTTRVFALGIGHGASHALVDGIARVGGGTAEYCISDELEAKVISQLKIAVQPAYENVIVKWDGLVPVPPTSPPAYTATQPEDATTVHPGIVCDVTEMSPIVGKRYHKIGLDYDLCEAEFQKLDKHVRVHYEVIVRPGDVPIPYTQHIRIQPQPQPQPQPQQQGAQGVNSLLGAFAPSSAGSLLGFVSKTPAPTNPSQAVGYAAAPFHPSFVLSGERHMNFCMVEPGRGIPTQVHISATTPVGNLEVTLQVSEKDVVEGDLVHTMAARALITDLTDGTSWLHHHHQQQQQQVIKNEIVRLGTKHGLVSQHTSYIAIQEGTPQHNLFFESSPPPPSHPQYLQQLHSVRSRMSGASGSSRMKVCSPMHAPRDDSASRCVRHCTAPPPPLSSSSFSFIDNMDTNMDTVLQRGEQLDLLCDKSESLSVQSKSFSKAAKKPQSSSWGLGGGMFNLFGGSSTSSNSNSNSNSNSGFGSLNAMPSKQKMKKSKQRDVTETRRPQQHQLQLDEELDNELQQQLQEQDKLIDDLLVTPKQQHQQHQPQQPQQQQQSQQQQPHMSDSQTLQQLIAAQDFSGFFDPQQVSLLTKVSMNTLLQTTTNHLPTLATELALKVVATALAITFLKTSLAHLATEWQLIVTKANKWLTRATTTNDNNNDNTLTTAAQLTQAAQTLLIAV